MRREPPTGDFVQSPMRAILLCLLVATAADAKYKKPQAAASEFVVIHDWVLRPLVLEKGKVPELLLNRKYTVDYFYLADRVCSSAICTGNYRAAAYKHLLGLDPKLPIVVELATKKKKGGIWFVAGIWQLDAKRLQKDLQLVAKRVDGRISVTLVNRGKVPHTVVVPKDGSESGWREPAVHFERKIDDKRWARGNGIGRCGMFARDWTRDIKTLKPGESLEIGDGFAPIGLTHGKGKMTIRAHYEYRSPGKPDGIGPAGMGRTPGFALVSNELELSADS